jgi:hypothetical protein
LVRLRKVYTRVYTSVCSDTVVPFHVGYCTSVIENNVEDLPQKKPFNLLLLYSSHDHNWKTYVSIFGKTLKQIKIIRRKCLTKKICD